MYEAYIIGLLPRNDELITVWKKFERDESYREEFYNVLSRSLQELVDLQMEVGLSYIHDPLIDWHDIFRPFTELKEIEVGPITRYFENNTFYKKPIFRGEPRYPEGFIRKFIHLDILPKDLHWIITLPGPYTFYKLSEFSEDIDPIKSVTNILYSSVDDLVRFGYKYIVFLEPSIAYDENIDIDLLEKLYGRFVSFKKYLKVHLFFGDVSRAINLLDHLPIASYSVDLQYTDILSMDCPSKNITLGVIDGQNTLMEDMDLIERIIEKFTIRCSNDSIGLSNNVDLDFLPYDIAVEKIRLLGKLYKRLR